MELKSTSEDKNINRIADYIEGKILQGLEETPKVSILIVGESEAEGAVLIEGGDIELSYLNDSIIPKEKALVL